MDLQDAVAGELLDADVKRVTEFLSEDEQERLIQQLEDHREEQLRGVRATNKAAAMDCLQAANSIGDQVRR